MSAEAAKPAGEHALDLLYEALFKEAAAAGINVVLPSGEVIEPGQIGRFEEVRDSEGKLTGAKVTLLAHQVRLRGVPA